MNNKYPPQIIVGDREVRYLRSDVVSVSQNVKYYKDTERGKVFAVIEVEKSRLGAKALDGEVIDEMTAALLLDCRYSITNLLATPGVSFPTEQIAIAHKTLREIEWRLGLQDSTGGE